MNFARKALCNGVKLKRVCCLACGLGKMQVYVPAGPHGIRG